MASAAVQSEWMAGLCLPLTTSCLPTALILHRGHWSGSYWFLLFLSYRLFFLPLYICLSLCLRSVCPGQEDQAGGDGQLSQQPTSWRAKRRERWPQPLSRWVVPPNTHAHTRARVGECEMFNYSHMTRRAGCCLYTFCDAKSIQLEQLCLCAAAEASWLKPGCDITSAACVFPLRGCEWIKTNCSSDESVSSDGIRKKTSGAGNPNHQSIRSRCFCLLFLFFIFSFPSW